MNINSLVKSQVNLMTQRGRESMILMWKLMVTV